MPPRTADAEDTKRGRDPFVGWRPRSLRARQLLAASLGLVAFLALAGYALDRAFVSTAEQNLRHRLKGYAMSYANKVEFARDGSLIPPELPVDPRFNQPGSGLYAEVVLPGARWGSDSTLGPVLAEADMLRPLQEAFHGPVPITLIDGDAFVLADFHFTGWGGKFEGGQDDRLVEGLVERGLFARATHRRIDWALEGGAIESDGAGTIMTTWKCLTQRHPQQSRTAMTMQLKQALHAERVLWLEHGYLEGDDTDAHIDTLARFAPDDAIVYQGCDDKADSHHAELAAMANELASLRTRDGRHYTLHALPWAEPILDETRRLAASYANYLIVNGAVLVPAYGSQTDAEAARIIGLAHPGREIVSVPCRPLIWQNGSLHCQTMQLPAGVLAA